MDRPQELPEELQDCLSLLHAQVQSLQNEGADTTVIDQTINQFDIDWHDRLALERRAESRGVQLGIREAAFEQERIAKARENRIDLEAIRGDDPNTMFLEWNALRRDLNPSPERQKIIEREIKPHQDAASREVAEKYNRLEDGMQQALDDIQRGKSPDLRFTLEKQLEKEETKAKNQDLLDMLEQARARSREEERER